MREMVKVNKKKLVKRALLKNVNSVVLEKFIMFYYLGYWPNIKNPQSLNEKVAYRKHYLKDIEPRFVDKYEVRSYVEEVVGKKFLTKLYAVTRDVQSLNYSELPDAFVIKATHNSGPVQIIQKKTKRAFKHAVQEIERQLHSPYGDWTMEYWYRELQPRLVVEELLPGPFDGRLNEYKIFVFHGVARFISIYRDGQKGETGKLVILDLNWHVINVTFRQASFTPPQKPQNFKYIIEIAERLGAQFSFVRVDLYELENGNVKFGELTFGPKGGRGNFKPRAYDFKFGSYWNIKE
ncbi:MAG: ATP-grasp fold amidoligase family protein [Balneolales bacterium]